MKVIYSGTFQYKMGHIASKEAAFLCGLDIVEYENGTICVVLTERNDNNALSITNVCDRIASQIYADYLPGIGENKIVWLEHYPAKKSGKAYIDLVLFDFEVVPSQGSGPQTAGTLRFYHPNWQRLIESRRLDLEEFLNSHSEMIRSLYHAQVIFEVEDRSGYFWRVVTGRERLFVVTSNPDAGVPDRGFDVQGINQLFREKKEFFNRDIDLEQRFTDELIKGFLNKGL